MNIRLRFLLAGFCIGLAELLPGISGATVALMFGIYKKLIECISKLKDLDLLIPLLLGMVVGIFGFSKLINFLFLSYTNLFELFIGILMILYGTYLFFSNIQISQRKDLILFSLLFLIAIGLGIFIGDLSGFSVSISTFPLVIYGFIAFSFLLIPGISGSAFLLAIGIYPLIIGSVADLNLPVLFPFAIGMLLSLIIMPRLIKKLLSLFDKYIYMIFAGFILGAGSSII
ncbi:MAG: undecaprenyl phosphate translocase family protein [Gammaproteobacteria bacterium]